MAEWLSRTERLIGEENIEQVLKDNKVNFIREFSFPQLFKQKKLRFDFAILSNGKLIRLIEFDGTQHTKPASGYFENSLEEI